MPGADHGLLGRMVEQYGYLAVLVGTFLEGETILVLGGLAVFNGHLQMQGVILCAFFGSLCGDQLWFYVGRRGGRALLARKPRWKPAMDRIDRLMTKHQIWFMLIFRFLYGLRTVAPFAIGMSQIRIPMFTILNIIGALVWAVAVAWLGFFIGDVLNTPAVRTYERLAVGVLITGFAALWWWRWRRGQRAARAAAQITVAVSPPAPPLPAVPIPCSRSETADA